MKNRSVSTTAFAAVAALSIAVAGCDSEVTADAGDVLANDSTLALQVLQANGDTQATAPQAQEPIDSIAAGLPLSVPAPVAPAPSVVTAPEAPAPASSVNPAPARSTKARVATTHRRIRNVRASAPRQASVTRPTVSPSPARQPRNIVLATPGGMWLVIPAGSVIDLESSQRVRSNTAMAGDLFSAEVSEPLVRAGGTIIPEGSTARAEVVSVGEPGDPRMEVRIHSLLVNGRTYLVSSRVTSADTKKVRVKSGSSAAGRVGAGAAAGAVIGGILGRDVKSTVIGAATGAAAGSVLSSRSRAVARCLQDGGRMTAELTEPLRVAFSE